MQFTLKSALLGLLATSVAAAPVEGRAAATAKKGVGYNNAKLASAFKGTAAWGYNWDTTANGLDNSIKFVPMAHKPSDGAAALAVAKSAGYLLGYNEPDMDVGHGGCATSPTSAAGSWKTLAAGAGGFKLGSPAITSHNGNDGPIGPSGLTWMHQFITAVGGPAASKIDFVNLHWYGEGGKDGKAQAKLLQDYLTKASSDLNGLFKKSMPIWLTEFAAIPAEDANLQASFLDAMIPWLDKQSFIERYAPYKVETGFLTASSASGQSFIKAN